MTNKCEIAEFLIQNAKSYIDNNKIITYENIYNEFDRNRMLWSNIEEVENYITNMDTYMHNGDNITPQYTVIIKTKTGFPANGFFDKFKIINREAYYKITNKHNTTTLDQNEMQNIVNIANSVLELEINSKFALEDEIRDFLIDMEYSGKC